MSGDEITLDLIEIMKNDPLTVENCEMESDD